jgi:hypothetical protein
MTRSNQILVCLTNDYCLDLGRTISINHLYGVGLKFLATLRSTPIGQFHSNSWQ